MANTQQHAHIMKNSFIFTSIILYGLSTKNFNNRNRAMWNNIFNFTFHLFTIRYGFYKRKLQKPYFRKLWVRNGKIINQTTKVKNRHSNFTIRNPAFIDEFEQIIELGLKIKLVIIPIRDYSCSAKSRVSHNKLAGGLWNANDEDSQIAFYNKIMANYIYIATKHEIDTIFLNFDKMVSDGKYLFNKLETMMMENNIGFDVFVAVFDEAYLLV